MPETLKVGYFIESQANRRPTKAHLTLAQAKKLIQNRSYDEYTESELIKKLSQYPQHTYENFMININSHINQIQRKKMVDAGIIAETNSQ